MISISPPDIDGPGGSGQGWSYWSSFLGCPRRYALDQKSKAATDSKALATIGTYFHWLLEQYYQGVMAVNDEVAYERPADNSAWNEALRMFFAYQQEFPYDEFEVIGCEVEIEAASEDIVGIAPFTGRIDMVVRVREDQIDQIYKTRGILLEPGVYLLDTKTTSKQMSYEFEFWQSSIQLNAYMLVWDALHPNDKVKGTIVNVVQRNKKVIYRSHLIFPPEKDMKALVFQTLRRCQDLRDFNGEYTNVSRCYDYFKPCPHLVSGACDRGAND